MMRPRRGVGRGRPAGGRFVGGWFGAEERRATGRFLLLLLVLLLLPNREIGLLFGLNPRVIWSVVVFIAGLSLGGYLLSGWINPATAVFITGAIGGCVSPSLTVITLAEQTRANKALAPVHEVAAAIASTVLFPRMLVLVWIVAPPLARSLILPLVAMTAVGTGVTVFLWLRIRTAPTPRLEIRTPYRIRSALTIGAAVALLLAVANALDLAFTAPVARVGIVLAVTVDSAGNAAFAWLAGARRMAWIIGAILLFSAGIGTALIQLR